jgi:predicted Zn finger-like uncharacterized protein
MKIVCDACQAKYSISDDKVQGKVFKIRCKKCSNIIVVRGGTQAAEAAPAPQEKDTRVYDYGYEGGAGGGAPADDAVWHLVINQEQVGPMSVADVQQRFAAGEIDAETFAWREGFGDWLPLSQVDAFASMVASGALPSAGGGQAAVAAMFGGGDDAGTSRNDPADLFAAASSSKAAHQEDDDGGDLFGSKPAPAAAAASAANQKLRGERNENSVLFSLNNLAQLASNSPAPAPAAASSSSSGAGHATGAAGGEGSGLIDIRSMASAYLGGTGAAKPAASSGIGSIDDLPVFGGGGFSEPAVIMPTVARSSNNKILYVMIGAVGLLAIAAVIMVVILLKGNKNPPAAVASADKPTASDKDTKSSDDTKSGDTKPSDTPSGSAATPSGSAAPTATDTAQGSATQVAANDKQPVVHNAVAKQPATPTHTDKTVAPTHNAGVAAAPKAPSGGGTPPPAKTDKPADKTADAGGGCDEVSCVLSNYDGPCCAKFKKGGGGGASKPAGGGGGAAPAGGGGGAPKSDKPDLDRAMISSAIGAIKGKAMACGDKSSAKGMVKVHVKVDASGHISSVSVSQTPDPGLGACVAAAVQKASFPATSNGGSFSYPFPF